MKIRVALGFTVLLGGGIAVVSWQGLLPADWLAKESANIDRSKVPLVMAAHSPFVEIDWDDLMPADWFPENPFADYTDDELAAISDDGPEGQELMAALADILDNAPIVEALDGKQIRLPGFVVPLDFAVTEVTEFLLVPYYGACIHVPPPPANQMVYVTTETPAPIQGLFDIVWVDGTLHAHGVDSEFGVAGYTLEAYDVSPYEYE